MIGAGGKASVHRPRLISMTGKKKRNKARIATTRTRERWVPAIIFKNRDDEKLGRDARARARDIIIIPEIKPNPRAALRGKYCFAGKSETFRNRCGENSVRPQLKLKPRELCNTPRHLLPTSWKFTVFYWQK